MRACAGTGAGELLRPSEIRGARGCSFAARDRHVVAVRGTRIKLAWTPDLLMRILDHFLPLRNPADRAGNREKNGEHRGGKAHRLECDPGIEVDVGIELLLYEVVVVQGDPLELERDVQQRVVLGADLVQHFVAGLLHYLRARVVVLVNRGADP